MTGTLTNKISYLSNTILINIDNESHRLKTGKYFYSEI